MDNTRLAVLIGAITGLITAVTLFGGFVLSVLTFIRQGKRDDVIANIQHSVNGVHAEITASAKGQSDAEAKLAGNEGFAAGMAAERAEPMSPAGT